MNKLLMINRIDLWQFSSRNKGQNSQKSWSASVLRIDCYPIESKFKLVGKWPTAISNSNTFNFCIFNFILVLTTAEIIGEKRDYL